MTKSFYQCMALLILSIFIVSCSSNEKLSETSSPSAKKNILNKENNKKSENNKKIKISETNNLILGNWLGTLKVNEKQSLKLTLTVLSENGSLKALLGSPDQMAMGMKADFIEYKDYKVNIKLTKLNVEFNGKLKNNTIKGIFKQNGASFPLELSRVKSLESLQKTYKQTPQKPYPYIEEEITFLNKKINIELAGTLTYPKDIKKDTKIPAIIMIAGSGPNDRNETPMGHFLYIADKLTKQGYAVLRFDKRGIKKSKGDYKSATTYDFAEDVFYAVDYLLTKNFIDNKKIGLFGHSEGGMIAPVVNTMRKDISFMILMGAPGLKGVDVLLKQSRDILKVSGTNDKKINEIEDKNKKIYK